MSIPPPDAGSGDRAHAFMRKHDLFFGRADTDGDGRLSFDEFLGAIPERVRQMHSLSEIQAWFNLIDTDKSGFVSMEEFFRWSLSAASISSGSGIVQAFQRYDVDGSGSLDAREFRRICSEMGYEEHAGELLEVLPKTHDGRIDYRQLLRQNAPSATSREGVEITKSFLMSMAWDTLEDTATIDTSGWQVTASTPDTIREQLLALLTEHGVHFSDFFELLDLSNDLRLNLKEFAAAMQTHFGYSSPLETLEQIFNNLDSDGSGTVHFDELNAWITGRSFNNEQSVAAARQLTLAHRVLEEDDPWSERRLRLEMFRMLREAGLRMEHLFAAWDSSGDGRLSKREYLWHFKRLIGREKESLWYNKIRNAVVDTFNIIDSERNGYMEIDEVEKWLKETEPMPSLLFSPVNQAKLKSFMPPPRTPPVTGKCRATATLACDPTLGTALTHDE